MILLTALLAGLNFTCEDPALVQAAEAARVHSALYWTGRDLPGNWSAPCPIVVAKRTGNAGGVTSFRFDRGEVSGWRMKLVGRQESIITDAVPHEVDHMVRATLIRRPIVRWLDEGSASLMESRPEHARLRREARRFAASGRPVPFLDSAEYPSSPQAIAELYAVGFGLTEHLVRRLGPANVLKLQHADLDAGLADHGLTRDSLVRNWRTAALSTADDCVSAGCPLHSVHRVARCDPQTCTDPRPVLHVWTATWCPPCRQFWSDYATDPAFREALDARVHLHWTESPRTARRTLPTFELSGLSLTGYRGKQPLLSAINRALASRGRQSPESPIDEPAPAEAPPRRREGRSGEGRSEEPTSGENTPDRPPIPPPTQSPPPASGSPLRGHTLPLSSYPSSSEAHSNHDHGAALRRAGGLTLTFLEAAGIITGTAATGGLGVALFALTRLRRRLKTDDATDTPATGDARPPPVDAQAGATDTDADLVPLPRELDEARELLQLRHREGRVAALDALRGMVLDDELERLAAEGDAESAARLRALVDDRVRQIAPLSVKATGVNGDRPQELASAAPPCRLSVVAAYRRPTRIHKPINLRNPRLQPSWNHPCPSDPPASSNSAAPLRLSATCTSRPHSRR